MINFKDYYLNENINTELDEEELEEEWEITASYKDKQTADQKIRNLFKSYLEFLVGIDPTGKVKFKGKNPSTMRSLRNLLKNTGAHLGL